MWHVLQTYALATKIPHGLEVYSLPTSLRHGSPHRLGRDVQRKRSYQEAGEEAGQSQESLFWMRRWTVQRYST